MVKRILWLVAIVAICLGNNACKKKPNLAVQKAAEEAKWRDRQKQQAIKYYGELIKNHPDSPHVEEAKKKLEALGPATTPVKK